MEKQVSLYKVSSLEKIMTKDDIKRTFSSALVSPGEHFSYQIIMSADESVDSQYVFKLSVDSPFEENVKLYFVRSVVADLPRRVDADDDYLASKPCLIPDVLEPVKYQKNMVTYTNGLGAVWVEVAVPRDAKPGKYSVKVNFDLLDIDKHSNVSNPRPFIADTVELEVVGEALPPQELIFTQWFHVDAIASAHRVPVYSEEHWRLIESYMRLATELGMNMILTPVITPPLDTAPGTHRAITQLVKVFKDEKGYSFDFSLLERYVRLALSVGFKYFEISHLFSQWGCKYTPNIEVYENGVTHLKFSWDMLASDPEYKAFLSALIPELLEKFRELGVLNEVYFHISDEPSDTHLEAYTYASTLLKSLIGNTKTMDALSHIDFYERGLVEHPVCATDYIEPFIEARVPGLWAYYCCGQHTRVSNRFIGMPAYRNRAIGIQMYKYGIEGFLQWGYNFYYSKLALYEINPYVTTSTDGLYTSGDAFSVYPGRDGAIPSMRAFVFREALEDISLCRLLEKKIGKEAVIKLIEEEAGMEITFKSYPKDMEFFPRLTRKIKEMLR